MLLSIVEHGGDVCGHIALFSFLQEHVELVWVSLANFLQTVFRRPLLHLVTCAGSCYSKDFKTLQTFGRKTQIVLKTLRNCKLRNLDMPSDVLKQIMQPLNSQT